MIDALIAWLFLALFVGLVALVAIKLVQKFLPEFADIARLVFGGGAVIYLLWKLFNVVRGTTSFSL